jgi:hypothetical protein
MIAGWIGDTWRIPHGVTLNLGARYAVASNDFVSPGVTPTSILIDTGFAPYGVGDVGYREDIAPCAMSLHAPALPGVPGRRTI